MKKILFISHEASRTGAPILLLRLIAAIKKHSTLQILILLKTGGEMEKDFEALASTYVWNRQVAESGDKTFIKRLLNRSGFGAKTAQEIYRQEMLQHIMQADIVFNNTVTNVGLLKELPLAGKKIFTYIHELDIITAMFATREDVAYLQQVSEKIFVPCDAARQFLMREYALPEQDIALLKYIIPEPAAVVQVSPPDKTLKPPGSQVFLVGFCGTFDWRKGADLLPAIVKQIKALQQTADIHFVWIGAAKEAGLYLTCRHDLRKLELEQYVTFIEPVANSTEYLSQLDLLVLPSREDAFPLVVLEAAFYGVPSVYFEKAGGINEFCGTDAGMPAAYLDTGDMAKKIVQLKTDDALRNQLGHQAKQRVREYADDKAIAGDLLTCFKIPIS